MVQLVRSKMSGGENLGGSRLKITFGKLLLPKMVVDGMIFEINNFI